MYGWICFTYSFIVYKFERGVKILVRIIYVVFVGFRKVYGSVNYVLSIEVGG